MTLQLEEPGIWVVICSGCQYRLELFGIDTNWTNQEESFFSAVDSVKNCGWTIREVGHQFNHHDVTGFRAKYKREWAHICPDCDVDVVIARMSGQPRMANFDRVYNLGVEAAKAGKPRDPWNDAKSDKGMRAWLDGYDSVAGDGS